MGYKSPSSIVDRQSFTSHKEATDMSTVLSRAEEFIWRNARLLERHVFAQRFRGGAPEPILAALRPYQNPDGGFGNALEPDIRCPDSQPVPTQHGLEYAGLAGFDAELARRACDFLMTITTEEGGVPFVLPSVRAYPHAPWWDIGENPPASLNPTAAIAGILHQHGFAHPWLDRATAFCWPRVEAFDPNEMHDLACVIGFLCHVPDRERAKAQFDRIGQALLASDLVAEPGAEGYVRSALDWAPTPDHPFRPLFDAQQIEACLDVLVARQEADGGWPIAWEPPSPAAAAEWRGWVTVNTLTTLRENGRLS
jgi:hypothetical protein